MRKHESEEDVLRDAVLALQQQEEDVEAVAEAIADMEAGDRGVAFDAFIDEFREKHGLREEG
jgi:hypothetical protein